MNIVKANSHRAPIVAIHGAEGVGKTTLASKFPAPLGVLLEKGLPRGVTMDVVEDTSNLPAIMTAFKEIYAAKPSYQTLVVDTVDSLEALVIRHVCANNGWSTIETPSYGKGWIAADAVWRQVLGATSAIRDKHGMTVVLVGHSAIERIEDPRAPAYTSYQLRLHRRARALVMDICDVIGFLATDLKTITEDAGFNRERTRAAAGPARYLFVEGRPAFAAKNRYGMPDRIEIQKDFDIRNLTKFFAAPVPKTQETTQ